MNTNQSLVQSYRTVRQQTESLCLPLAIEDYVVQSIDDVSPVKWHLAHTTWFFETFILANTPHYSLFDVSFPYLFNSYYQSLGQPYPRAKRGLLSRPTVERIYAYRRAIDEAMQHYLSGLSDSEWQIISPILVLGLHHEQQHQELLLMDIKHNFSHHPNYPAYHIQTKPISNIPKSAMHFIEMQGGLIEVGHQGNAFSFDNELPRHKQFLNPYQLATRLVTNDEYAEFIAAGGYQKPDYWLADGWDIIQKNQWQAPLYWKKIDNTWYEFTLSGLIPCQDNDPVTHISYYEADAYARFRGLRLPTESEWEHVASTHDMSKTEGNFLEAQHFHPRSATQEKNHAMPQQLWGDVWEWTMSPYTPYPGYHPQVGALGEYNGKFMNNQMVLRGGSCVTPESHMRTTYRNFFQPDKRWQFGGIRLASHL